MLQNLYKGDLVVTQITDEDEACKRFFFSLQTRKQTENILERISNFRAPAQIFRLNLGGFGSPRGFKCKNTTPNI